MSTEHDRSAEPVLRAPMAPADGVVRAKRPERLPEVLTPEEVARVLAALLRRASGAERGAYLVAKLLAGAGIRLLERLSLRVKDLDLAAGSSQSARAREKDRVTVLPTNAVAPLAPGAVAHFGNPVVTPTRRTTPGR